MKKRTKKRAIGRLEALDRKERRIVADRMAADPRIGKALADLSSALLCALSATVGVPYTGVMSHNLAVAAKATTDLTGILMLGGES